MAKHLFPEPTLEQLFARPRWEVDDQTALVACGCGATTTIHRPSSVDEARAALKNHGWISTGIAFGVLCPDCVKKRSAKTARSWSNKRRSKQAPAKGLAKAPASTPTAPPEEPPAETLSGLPPASLDASAASPAAGGALRRLYSLLEENYDSTTGGRLLNAWTDTKLALEVGLSPQAVTTIRERDFGPLAPPINIALLKRLGRLESTLAEVKAMVKHLDQECATLKQKIQPGDV